MAQGASVVRPHSSPLMKLASRTRNIPIGATAQVTSPSERIGILRRRANSTTASTQPTKPPSRVMAPEHDPEKWPPVFGKRSCSSKTLKRDDDSKKVIPLWRVLSQARIGAGLADGRRNAHCHGQVRREP